MEVKRNEQSKAAKEQGKRPNREKLIGEVCRPGTPLGEDEDMADSDDEMETGGIFENRLCLLMNQGLENIYRMKLNEIRKVGWTVYNPSRKR